MNTGQLDLESALAAVGDLLTAEGKEIGIVVMGGTALNLLGLVKRTTQDVDVVALREPSSTEAELSLRPPDPLPESLIRAIQRVARDFGFPENWMNTAASLQWKDGLPPGLEDRLEWKKYGGLHVGLVSRYDLIFFKLYAAVDSGPKSVHYQDLLALRPSKEELQEAAAWVRTQDVSEGFQQMLDQALTQVAQDVD